MDRLLRRTLGPRAVRDAGLVARLRLRHLLVIRPRYLLPELLVQVIYGLVNNVLYRIIERLLLQIQELVQQFAKEEVAPLARSTDESGEFPVHLVKRMGELGFLAGTISAAYGGSEMDYLSYTLISEELGRADSSVRGFLAVHGSLVSLCINDWGSEAQKKNYLPH